MSKVNNELENLMDLFSNFYQTITINEPDNEKLKSNLHLFLKSFDSNDINFTKTQGFLKDLKKEGFNSPNPIVKNQEFSKCQPSLRKNSDFETYTNEDYIGYYNDLMNEMMNVDDKFKIKDRIPELKTKTSFLIDFLHTLKQNNEEIQKLILQKEDSNQMTFKEEKDYSSFRSLRSKTKSFIQRCIKCNREYVESEIKPNNNYLCNLCR